MATATAIAGSGSAYRAYALVQQNGGNGGDSYSGSGGAGAASTLVNAVSGSTTGILALTQNAVGGSGGSSTTGQGAAGGNASSSLLLTDTQASTLDVVVSAAGGSGGYGAGGTTGTAGNGTANGSINAMGALVLQGSASAGTGTGGAATSNMYGVGAGGNAVTITSSSQAGLGTAATANATATTFTLGSAVGDATATTSGAPTGIAMAQGTASDALGHKVVVTASAPTMTNSTSVRTQVSSGGNTYGTYYQFLGSGYPVAYSTAAALPNAAAVTQILGATHANVSNALAGNTVLGAGLLGANYATFGPSGSFTYTSSAEFIENFTGSSNLTLGLLDIGAYGNGFDSLSFNVKDGSTTLLSQTFNTLSSAQAFFTDGVQSLGVLPGNEFNYLTLSYSLTASAAEGAGITYIIGSAPAPAPVPVPSSWLLMVGGLGALGLMARRNRPGRHLPVARV